MIRDSANEIKPVTPTLLSTNTITSGVTDTAYQSRLIKLTPPIPGVIHSMDIPVVHDPRRMKRIMDESSRGILVKDSAIAVFGAILDCQDRPKTRHDRNGKQCAELNGIQYSMSQTEMDESFTKNDFWIFLSRLKTSPTKKREEESRESLEIPFIEKQQEVQDGQESECTKESDKVNAFTPDLDEDTDDVVIVKEIYKANGDIQEPPRISETELTCKDQHSNSKLGASGKGSASKISLPVLADTTSVLNNTDMGANKENASADAITKKSASCKTETKFTEIKNKSECAMQKLPELISDNVGSGALHIPVKIQRNQIKLNLKTFDQNKGTNATSESVSITSVVKEIPDITMTDICDEDTCTKKIDLKHENNQCVKPNCKRKRKISHTCITEINQVSTKRRKGIRDRFRIYFGECMTISEDEEDERIIQKHKPAKLNKRISNASVSSSCVEIIKEIQMAVPDSTMEEYNDEVCDKESIEDCSSAESDGVTRIESECPTEMNENGILDVLRNMCEANGTRMMKDDVLQKKLVNTGATDVMKVCQNTKDLKISTTSVTEESITTVDAENGSICATKTSSVVHNDRASPILNLDLTGIWNKNDTNTKEDLSELLHIKINEAYRVAFHGNVISIPENIQTDVNQNVINKPTNENTNLKGPSEVQLNTSHNVNLEHQIDSNVIERIVPTDNKTSNIQKDSEVTIVDNNIDHVRSNTCDAVRTDSQMMDSAEEKADTQPAIGGLFGKLRVLSSAELGSRWCPTPVGTTASDVSQISSPTSTIPDIPSKFTNAEISITPVIATAPVIVSVISAPTFRLVEKAPTIAHNERTRTMSHEERTRTMSHKERTRTTSHKLRTPAMSGNEMNAKICSDGIRNSLKNIIDHIKNNRLTIEHRNSVKQSTIRTSVTPNLRSYYTTSPSVLLKELETIGKLKQNKNFDDVVKYVVDEINKEWSENPLTYDEFIYYVPFHNSLYYCKPCPNITVTVPSSITSSNQNLLNNSKMAISTPPIRRLTNYVNAGTTQVRSESAKPATGKKRCTRPHQKHSNVDPKTSHDEKNNLQPGTQTLPQAATLRNIAPLNFVNAHNAQQINYVPEMIQTLPQQTAYVQYVGTKPMVQTSQPLQAQRTFMHLPNVRYASMKHCDHASTMNTPTPNPYAQCCVDTSHVIRTDFPNMRQLVQQSIAKRYENCLPNLNLLTPNQEPQYVTYQKQVYNTPNITCHSSQNVQHTVPTLPQYTLAPNYIPHPVQCPQNTYQVRSSNVLQKQTIPQSMTLNSGFASDAMPLPQQMPHNAQYSSTIPQKAMSQEAAGTKVPSSTGWEWKDHSISRYYNITQKSTLLTQVQFFINNCSMWVQEHTENAKLQEFYKALKKHLEKILWNITQYASQVVPALNTCTNNKNDSVQKMQTTIQETQPCVHLNDIPTVVEERSKLVNIEKVVTPCKENLSTVVDKQPEEVRESIEELEEKSQDIPQKKAVFENKNNEGTTQKFVEQNQSTLEEKDLELPQDVQKPPKQSMLRRYLETSDEKQENEEEVLGQTLKNSSGPQENVLIVHDLAERHENVSPQPTPVLVTVEISPCNDQVKVITTNAVGVSSDSVVENNDLNKTEECPQSLDEQHCQNTVALSLSAVQDIISKEPIPAAYKIIDVDLDETLSEGSVTHIADVRSIPLDVFEQMGDSGYATVANNDGEFEEEENKVCLYCSKKSTVVCEKCWQAQYCSKTCAELHWNDHYKDCKPSKHVYTEYNSRGSLYNDVHHSASVT